MPQNNGYEALKIEIDNLKEDISEIKANAKESNNYFREVIDTLKENSIRQTEILNNQEKQFARVNQDIAGLRNDMQENIQAQTNNLEAQTAWYQSFLSDNTGLVLKILFIIIMALLGAKAVGFDISKLLG